MKKFTSILLVFVMMLCSVFAFAGCSKNTEAKFDMVFITDGASITEGYNASAWEGVQNASKEQNVDCRYYQPSLNTDGKLDNEIIKNYFDLAKEDGAKYIVIQGEAFATALDEFASEYKDINFLLVGSHLAKTQENVMTVSFDTLEAGFLAGYTSVLKGMDRLGYFGSVIDTDSAFYGSGFVQGAGYASDEKGTPTILEYANYDAKDLNYDYSFTIKPIYQKVSEAKEQTFKVNVVGGLGSGVYTDGENVAIIADNAPEGKKFDHWEVKSDTKGVSDKKVNISSAKKSTMNLLVEKCDCTITAVWADVETEQLIVWNPLTQEELEAEQAMSRINGTEYFYEKDTTQWITAPAAPDGMVFDHWEGSVENVEDVHSAGTNVSIGHEGATILYPIYVELKEPTFDVKVIDGTGSGAYRTGDYVEVVANAPQDGYMFYKWENVDNQGLNTGISMGNEYNYNTSFEMVDRYASIPEAMFDDGTQVVFGGGNNQAISIFTASWTISHQVYGFGWGTDQNNLGNCLASVVNDYRVAVENCIREYKGGTNYIGNCSNNCLYTTNIDVNKTVTDKDGNEIENENYDKEYVNVYDTLANGKINLKPATTNPTTVNSSKTLTVNYWVK